MSVMDESRKSTGRVTWRPGGIGSDAAAGWSEAPAASAPTPSPPSFMRSPHRRLSSKSMSALQRLSTTLTCRRWNTHDERTAHTPTDLARHLGISTAAATVMVDWLTAVGHAFHREPPRPPEGSSSCHRICPGTRDSHPCSGWHSSPHSSASLGPTQVTHFLPK
jgi:hypothetical protein